MIYGCTLVICSSWPPRSRALEISYQDRFTEYHTHPQIPIPVPNTIIKNHLQISLRTLGFLKWSVYSQSHYNQTSDRCKPFLPSHYKTSFANTPPVFPFPSESPALERLQSQPRSRAEERKKKHISNHPTPSLQLSRAGAPSFLLPRANLEGECEQK